MPQEKISHLKIEFGWLVYLNYMPKWSFGPKDLLNLKNKGIVLVVIESKVSILIFFFLQSEILFYCVVIRERTLKSQMISKGYKTSCIFKMPKLETTKFILKMSYSYSNENLYLYTENILVVVRSRAWGMMKWVKGIKRYNFQLSNKYILGMLCTTWWL